MLPENRVGLGMLVPSTPMYAWPENSVLDYYRQGGISQSAGLSGLGCGGDCGCAYCGGTGLGALTDDFSKMFSDLGTGQFSAAWSDFLTAMQEPVLGMPFWVIGGGALLAYAFFFSGGPAHSRYSRARRAVRSARSAYA